MAIYKLKNLKCSVIKFDSNNNSYVDHNVKLEDSPWIPYLENKNTDKLFESFKATQNHPDHLDNYWYPLEKFDKLVESIKKYGYKSEFCNNMKFQNTFNGNDWPGGKGIVKIGDGKIGDGHHRCAILYYLCGPEKEVVVINNILQNVSVN